MGRVTWSSIFCEWDITRNLWFYSFTEHQTRCWCRDLTRRLDTVEALSAHRCALFSSPKWCSKTLLAVSSLSNAHIFSVLALMRSGAATAEGGELGCAGSLLRNRRICGERLYLEGLVAWVGAATSPHTDSNVGALMMLLHTFRDSGAVLSFSAQTFTLVWVCSHVSLRGNQTDAALWVLETTKLTNVQ